MKKKWQHGLILFILCGAFAGCGNAQNKDTSQKVDLSSGEKDYVYVSQKEEFSSTDYISGAYSTEEKLYITTYRKEEGDNRAFSIDLATRESTFLRLPLEEKGSSMVNQITMDPDGNLVFFEKNRDEKSTFYYIKICTPDRGELLSSLDVTSVFAEGYVSGLAVDKENHFYLASDNRILAVDSQGAELFQINPNIKWFLDMQTGADGNVAFLAASDTENGLLLGIIDPEQNGAVQYCDGIEGANSDGGLAWGKSGQLYVSCNGKVYLYDKGHGTLTQEFIWNESRINSNKVRFFAAVGEEEFAVVLTEGVGEQYSTQLAWLTRIPRSEADLRKSLTLGIFADNADIQAYVEYFNSVSTEYQIELKTYCSDYRDQEKGRQARVQMMLDLISGNGPDLIETRYLDFNMLASKGIVEDLRPYLEEDPDLKDVDFFPSVLNICSVDEKLYCIPDSFSMEVLAGREEDCKGLESATLEELTAFGEQYTGERMMTYYDKSWLLDTLFGCMVSRYIDWNAGECHFNSDDFIQLLEFADRFGMSEEEAQAAWNLPDGEDQEFVLERMDIFNVLDYKAMKLRVGEPVVLVGYPMDESAEGNGVLLNFHPRFEICSFSENKEGAWEFIRCFLLPEYYESALEASPEYMLFPTRKDIYDRVFEKWMETETVSGEDGEERIQGVYEYTDYDGKWGSEAVTQEDKDAVTEIIESVTVSSGTWNYDVLAILEEEAAPFFAGQKSAKEAAEIIQSRVQLYVRENL